MIIKHILSKNTIVFHYWNYFQKNARDFFIYLIPEMFSGKFILDMFWLEKVWAGFEIENVM